MGCKEELDSENKDLLDMAFLRARYWLLAGLLAGLALASHVKNDEQAVTSFDSLSLEQLDEKLQVSTQVLQLNPILN